MSLDIAKNRLFGELDVADIRLFPGTNRDVTPDQFSAEILRIIAEMEAETESNVPQLGHI